MHIGTVERTPGYEKRLAQRARPTMDIMDRALADVRAHGGAEHGGRWVMGSAAYAAFIAEGGRAEHRGYLIAIAADRIGIGFESAPILRIAARCRAPPMSPCRMAGATWRRRRAASPSASITIRATRIVSTRTRTS